MTRPQDSFRPSLTLSSSYSLHLTLRNYSSLSLSTFFSLHSSLSLSLPLLLYSPLLILFHIFSLQCLSFCPSIFLMNVSLLTFSPPPPPTPTLSHACHLFFHFLTQHLALCMSISSLSSSPYASITSPRFSLSVLPLFLPLSLLIYLLFPNLSHPHVHVCTCAPTPECTCANMHTQMHIFKGIAS